MVADQRFVITVSIVGALHRDAPKLKVFMVSVSWSDESEVIVYRSFQDFKKFHGQLKKRFPQMNPFRRNNRMIPKFRGKAMKSSLKQKGTSRSIRRMRFLESYCIKLLKCDITVTQSSEVTQFFMPKGHDLQPDFTKNTAMILLTDDLPEGSDGGGENVTQHTGSVSHPFVTQTYCCVAAYETKDTKNRPFKVALDEKVDVLIKDPAGWWLVENEQKCLAWFPAPYLELWDSEEDTDDDSGFHLAGALYCTVRSYSTKKHDEVSVAIGSVVEVLRKSDDGWWLIRFNGKSGYVPSMYLQPYNNPRAGLYSLQRKLHSSTLNLATSRDLQTGSSHQPSITEENIPRQDSLIPLRSESVVPKRLHKARSLDVLSETWTQAALPGQTGSDTSTPESRMRSMSHMSTESSLSNFSSGSDSLSSSREGEEVQSNSDPPNGGISGASSDSSGSVRSKGSETTSFGPRVPPRPKTEEILTRCTTMTRKAALATKTRLQLQPEPQRSR
ncbi:hypothetical protein LDENG_00295430 [Lucifuga dentata]|nr:hypothetical protein LDENG_00295430 [Lucifuga dentata]